MKRIWRRIPVKFFDVVLILFALTLTVFSAWTAYAGHKNTARVLIRSPEQEWIFPLDAIETVIVPGPLGNTVVKIQGKTARVDSSPCANQTCVAAGTIHRRGQWTACLPNNVFLMIEGNDEGGRNETDPDAYAW